MKLFTISSSPHLFSKTTVPEIMGGVIIALIPITVASIYFFGLKAIELILTCVSVSIITEYLFFKLRKRKIPRDPSAIVTGLLLALILPPSLPLWAAALGAAFSILIVKQIFGGLGYNIFNPALAGRALLVATYPVLMTTWNQPFTLDAVTTATPLGLAKFHSHFTPLLKLFLGNVSGSLGETSALAILIGAGYLFVKRYIDWRVPLSYLSTVVILSEIFYLFNPHYGSVMFHLLSGGLMLGVFFMATDPVTTPITKSGRWVFGVGAGIMVVVIRNFGGYAEGVMFSILLMNALTPLLDKYLRSRIYGVAK